jgi:sugar-specific transcriptional regulator TrmB/CBS domain-containing protein
MDFGLTDRQSEVYLFLAKTGACTAVYASNALNICRTEVYQILKELQKKSLVESTLEFPKRFTAIPFEEALNFLIKAKKDEVEYLEKDKDRLLSSWKSIEVRKPETSSEKFMLLKGRDRIYSRISQMIEETKDEFWMMITALGIIRLETAGIIDAVTKRNVRFRILTNISPESIATVRHIFSTIETHPKIEVRHVEFGVKLCPRLVIKDGEEAILFVTPKEDRSIPRQEEIGLWIDCKSFISTLIALLEGIWTDSMNWRTRISVIERKLSCAMRSPAVSVPTSDLVSTVVDKMVENDIGAVIVTEDKKPVGVITENDILKRVLKLQRNPNGIYAKDIMSSPIITIEYDRDLTDAMKLMQEKRIRRLAITKNGTLIGIVTERRILNAQVCPGLIKISI